MSCNFSGSPIFLPPDGITLEEARNAIDSLKDRPLFNKQTKIYARLSSSAKGKLVSNKATGKSTANGFTRNQHNAMAAMIGDLFEDAILQSTRPDRNDDANILSIKRFATEVRFSSLKAVAWITVKESRQHGHHIYSVEAIKLEALGRKVEVACASTPHAPSASTPQSISFFSRLVNGILGTNFKS